MPYYYQFRCFNSQAEYIASVAADCPAVSGGAAIKCTPSATDLFIERTDISTGITTSLTYVPPAIDCPDMTADVIDLSWKVAWVLVIAWGFRVLYKVIFQ